MEPENRKNPYKIRAKTIAQVEGALYGCHRSQINKELAVLLKDEIASPTQDLADVWAYAYDTIENF